VSRGPLRHPLLDACGVEHGFGVRGEAAPPDVRRARQVHGARVATVGECALAPPPAADAVTSDVPGIRIGVVTADCVPLLLATSCGSAVAAVHAGWRGLAAGVVGAGASALRNLAPAASGLVAAIGPHIGPCCYEVDAPVLTALEQRFASALPAALRPTRPGHAALDLGALVRSDLLASGLPAASIGGLRDACTHCHPERYHSYRRDGSAAGRLVHFIAAGRQQA